MAEGAAVALVGGTLLQIQANERQADAEERASIQSASNKRAQAIELLDRFALNAEILKKKGSLFKQSQLASFVRGGVGSSGTPLNVLEETNNQLLEQILSEKREAEFKADQLFKGVDVQLELAGDVRSARRVQSIGLFFQGIGRGAKKLP